jgi:hypothetical protein
VISEWRANFPDAQPGHVVFPSEKVGLRGEDGYLHGRSVAYAIDPTKPMGSWKVAFAGALKKAGITGATIAGGHGTTTKQADIMPALSAQAQ